ncbi:MAG: CBS domain-containing protein [Thermoleophilia bacterium]|nr:CBS domain-containing protein [Thermoleophilia bacterium]
MGTVSDAMRSDFVSVAPEDTLGEVAQKMVEAKTGAVAVLDYGRLVGILTERDMLKAMAGRVLTSDARAREWMTADPVVAEPDLGLEQAQEIMLSQGFRHLPVVEGGRVLGIVSLRRVAASMAQIPLEQT